MVRFWSTLAAIVACALAVDATQAMVRPANYDGDRTAAPVVKRDGPGKTQFGYFTNWGIYSGYNFKPENIIPETLTHILYCFADISDSGEAKLTDNYADEQIHYPGDTWDTAGNILYGNFKQLYLLKLKHRTLKVLLSVGGWTYSQANHFNFVTDAGKRTTFVNSVTTFIEDYGLDGIDIDFEYPSGDDQATGYASLLKEMRASFDKLASDKNDTTPYLISAAVPAGPDKYEKLKISDMNAALDFWNLMSYDYAGSWLNFSDHQANLYGGSRTNTSTDQALTYYLANGATASKINLGIPLYGRAFEDTDGIGKPYNGIGPGSVEKGVYSYKFLPISGAEITESAEDGASYSYDKTKRELVSYDTPNMTKTKAKYIQDKGLAGAMFWELSGDKIGDDSLVGTTASAFGTLDQTQNHISYPKSKWDNIRNNMGQST